MLFIFVVLHQLLLYKNVAKLFLAAFTMLFKKKRIMSTSYAILVFAIHLCFLSNCLVTESTHSLAKNLLKRPVLYACKVKSICILDNTVGLLIHQMPSNILIHISVAFPLISIRIHDFCRIVRLLSCHLGFLKWSY